jgi:hypothetical protein
VVEIVAAPDPRRARWVGASLAFVGALLIVGAGRSIFNSYPAAAILLIGLYALPIGIPIASIGGWAFGPAVMAPDLDGWAVSRRASAYGFFVWTVSLVVSTIVLAASTYPGPTDPIGFVSVVALTGLFAAIYGSPFLLLCIPAAIVWAFGLRSSFDLWDSAIHQSRAMAWADRSLGTRGLIPVVLAVLAFVVATVWFLSAP